MRTKTHKQISSLGGKATLSIYGPGHFSEIGKRGAETKLKKYGVEYFKNISRLAVEARRKKIEKDNLGT